MELSQILAGEPTGGLPYGPPTVGRFLDRLLSGGSEPGRGGLAWELFSGIGTCLQVPEATTRGLTHPTLPLEVVAAVPGVVIRVQPTEGRAIPREAFDGPDALSGCAVLLETGWDARWGTGSYRELGPYLSREAADLIVEAGVRILGVDFRNVDDTGGPDRPIRTRLLAAGIPLVERLANLSALPRSGFRFYAIPLRIAHALALPIRAFAEVG